MPTPEHSNHPLDDDSARPSEESAENASPFTFPPIGEGRWLVPSEVLETKEEHDARDAYGAFLSSLSGIVERTALQVGERLRQELGRIPKPEEILVELEAPLAELYKLYRLKLEFPYSPESDNWWLLQLEAWFLRWEAWLKQHYPQYVENPPPPPNVR